MSDVAPPPHVPSALRFWAVLDGVYAVLVAALAVFALPWKSPLYNALVLLWAASLLGGAPLLYRGSRLGHRLAVGSSLVGLAGAMLAMAGLVASWAYLRAAYGAFGAGASLASLLVAGMVWQVLGLYPALRLRALLRREIRQAVGELAGGGRSSAAARAALVLALLPVPVGVAIDARFRLRPVEAVPDEAVAASLSLLRARLRGDVLAAPALERLPLGPGPLYVTLWDGGRKVARVEGTGPSLGAAIVQAGDRMAAALAAAGIAKGEGRLKVDRTVARGPVVRGWPLALALGLDPGLDGLVDGDDRLIFLPDDVLVAAVAGNAAPLPALAELRAGLDVPWIEGKVAAAGVTGPLFRVRSESWIETAAGGARVHRGNVVAGALAPRPAAELSGDYLLRQSETDGRFRYRYQPYSDATLSPGEYSLARHAGAAYGLSQLYAETGAQRFADGAQAALSWLALQLHEACGPAPGRRCLREGGRVAFGPSALSAVAMFEYQRRTGDARFAALAGELAAFLADRQRRDGDFDHGFDAQTGAVIPGPPRLFASEQAALALVLAHRVGGRPEALAAAERALDFLTRRKYDFWLGRFIYGADHWTCIAAEEAWPALKHRHYLDFCTGYAAFMRRLQYRPDPEAPVRDFAGHYGFGYQLVPQAPATAGFTEALLSTLALARHHRLSAAEVGPLEDDARRAVGALTREQLRPENSYLVAHPERAAGGFRRSLVEPEIRVDFVQHAASALARAGGLGVAPL
jgi:hypothetical protein